MALLNLIKLIKCNQIRIASSEGRRAATYCIALLFWTFFPQVSVSQTLNSDSILFRSCLNNSIPEFIRVDKNNIAMRTEYGCKILDDGEAINLLHKINNTSPLISHPALRCLKNTHSKILRQILSGLQDSSLQEMSPLPFENRTVDIFVATDRKPTGSLFTEDFYDDDRSELNFSFIQVAVPGDRRMGEINEPDVSSIRKMIFGDGYDPNKHFSSGGPYTIKNAEEFRKTIVKKSINSNSNDVLIFVHGYNNSFKDAVYRAAQIAADISFVGPVILYSWPSSGTEKDYIRDENMAASTTDSFRKFFEGVFRNLCGYSVHLLAHSMGTRIVLESAKLWHAENGAVAPRPIFNQIVLAAPDIDVEIFRQGSASVSNISNNVTIYSSEKDFPLWLSGEVHGDDRVGRIGRKKLQRIFAKSGNYRSGLNLDFVDTSRLSEKDDSHSYFAEPIILKDIYDLLFHERHVNYRFGLRCDGNYCSILD